MKFKWFRARLQFRQHTPVNPSFVVGVYKRSVDPEFLAAAEETPSSPEPIINKNGDNKIRKNFTENFANPNTYMRPTSTHQNETETENNSDYVAPIQIINNSNKKFSADYLTPQDNFDNSDDLFGENTRYNNNDNVFDDAISDFPPRQNSSYDDSSEPDYINEITNNKSKNIETKNEYLTLTATPVDDEDVFYLPIKQSPSVTKKDIKRIKQRTRSRDSISSCDESIVNNNNNNVATTKYQKNNKDARTVSFFERQDSIEEQEDEYSSAAANIFLKKPNRLSPSTTKAKPSRNLTSPNTKNDNSNNQVRGIKLGSNIYYDDNSSISSQTSA